MDRFAKQFGTRVKSARSGRGLTQTQLATMAAVGANYVPRIERGEMTPSVDAAFRLAQALGVSVDELCGPLLHRDGVQEATRSLMALSDGELLVLRKVIRALEQLRGTLRTAAKASLDGAGGGRKGAGAKPKTNGASKRSVRSGDRSRARG
jgi:transcriptional regulator with XRE-family HTH domain